MSSSKVPEVTLAFWVMKVAATTLGETGGDAVSMTMHLGYALSSAVFLAFFLVSATVQLSSRTFQPFLFWSVIVATTTAGTTMADFADRSLGIGYVGGSLVLLASLMAVLGLWRFCLGSISVNRIVTRKTEAFYWATIVFAAVLALIVLAYFYTDISRTLLFWLAFVFTRPLGATLGDLLTKPLAHGGLSFGRITSSLVIAIFIFGCILFTSQKGGDHGGESGSARSN